jgi:hypothetical protein
MIITENVIEQKPGLLRVDLPDCDGSYELTCSPLLVQAVGDCFGIAFYFGAKHGDWEFETEDEVGHPFPEGDARRFMEKGRYDIAKPGVMGLEWSARLLRRCLEQWLTTAKNPTQRN